MVFLYNRVIKFPTNKITQNMEIFKTLIIYIKKNLQILKLSFLKLSGRTQLQVQITKKSTNKSKIKIADSQNR